jgi:hypothetical protein
MSSVDRNSVFSFGENLENEEKPSSSSVLPDFGAPPVSHDRADYRNVIKHSFENTSERWVDLG